MKTTILRIINRSSIETTVEFSSPFGNCRSVFTGALPSIDQSYEVELTIDDELLWNHNIFPSKENTPSIKFDSGNVHITAELLAMEDDGCGAIKMGNSVTLISVNKVNYNLPIFVDIIAKNTSLSATNI